MLQRLKIVPLYLKFLILLLPILITFTLALSLFFYLLLKEKVYLNSWQRLELFVSELDSIGSFVKHHLRPTFLSLVEFRENFSPQLLTLISTTRARKTIISDIQKKFPELQFERLSPYPINPENRLKGEAEWIFLQFRKDPYLKEWRGRLNLGGEYLILTKPIYAEEGCLNCHFPSGPLHRVLKKIYPSFQGKPWQAGELMGIEIYKLDLKNTLSEIKSTAVTFFIVGTIFVISLLLALGSLFFTLVSKPLQNLSSYFVKVREGKRPLSALITKEDRDEIGILIREFNFLAEHLLKLQEELQKGLTTLQTVVDSITDPLALVSRDCEVIVCNRAFLDWREKECAKDLIFRVFQEKRALSEYYESKENKIYNLHIYPVFEGKEVVRVVTLIEDITEKKKLEERLMLMEKYASLGQISAGLSHELNNPLSGMLLIVKALQREDLPKPDRTRYLTLLLEGMQRMQKTLKSLLQFARAEELNPRTLNLVELMDKTLSFLEHLITSAKVQLKKRYKVDKILVKGDPQKLEQVFINLLLNAIQAMERSKVKELTVGIEKHGKDVLVSITDTGTGLPEEIRPRIFEPFFTTKPPGKGTGLGLTVSLTILQRHGGQIWFECTSTETTFYVSLPIEE